MKKLEIVKLIVATVVTLAIAGVAFHSVGEVHYLKTFYPATFSVQEVFYAALVEWVKFLLTAVPLLAGWLILKDFLDK